MKTERKMRASDILGAEGVRVHSYRNKHKCHDIKIAFNEKSQEDLQMDGAQTSTEVDRPKSRSYEFVYFDTSGTSVSNLPNIGVFAVPSFS